jgi:hypothetical protein
MMSNESQFAAIHKLLEFKVNPFEHWVQPFEFCNKQLIVKQILFVDK